MTRFAARFFAWPFSMLITFIFSYLETFSVLFYPPFFFNSGETPARATEHLQKERPTLRLLPLDATLPSVSTPLPSAMGSSRGGTTSRSPALAFPCSPPRAHPALSVSYPPLATTSFPAQSTRSFAHTTIVIGDPALPEVSRLAPLHTHGLGNPPPLARRARPAGCGRLRGPRRHHHLHCRTSRRHFPTALGCPSAQGSTSCTASVASSAKSYSLPSSCTSGMRCPSCPLPTTPPP